MNTVNARNAPYRLHLWTGRELELLRSMYGRYSSRVIADAINSISNSPVPVSVNSVRQQYYRMNKALQPKQSAA
jgi:hypothetical protein